MAHAGGQVGWDDVTIVGKRGPKGGTTLKSQQVTQNILFYIFRYIFRVPFARVRLG